MELGRECCEAMAAEIGMVRIWKRSAIATVAQVQRQAAAPVMTRTRTRRHAGTSLPAGAARPHLLTSPVWERHGLRPADRLPRQAGMLLARSHIHRLPSMVLNMTT
jgi:hypothetical protein